MSVTVKSLHSVSGIVIASFLLVHLTNHLFALGGPSLHIAVMHIFRHIYRFPPVEILLLCAVLFQIISGLWLVCKKGFTRQPFYIVMQILSGLYLSFFMIYHVRAVLMGRFLWKVDTNFFFAAGVANNYPSKLFFIPYYTLSVVCVFTHIACAHYSKRMGQLKGVSVSGPVSFLNAVPVLNPVSVLEQVDKVRKRIKMETIGICIAGAIITFLIMISFTGVLFPI